MKWNTIQYRKWLNKCTQGGGVEGGTLSNNFEFQQLKLIELSFEWSYLWVTFQRLGWNNLGTKCKHFGHWNVVWIKIKKRCWKLLFSRGSKIGIIIFACLQKGAATKTFFLPRFVVGGLRWLSTNQSSSLNVENVPRFLCHRFS